MELKVDSLAPQLRYARWLAWSTRLGLALLVLAYGAYVARLIPSHVPIEQLPSLWGLPAAEFLQRTGGRPGWHWIEFIASGDTLVLAAIAILISSSILCLAAIVPLFRKRGENLFVAICILQIAVLALAGSGLLSLR
jgi:hypothetical protein